MTHSDPDVLAMMAMGESGLPEADIRHIESCEECLSEMRSLHRVADLARSSRPDEQFPAPSPEVWNRISATLELDPTLRAAAHDDATDPVSEATVSEAPVSGEIDRSVAGPDDGATVDAHHRGSIRHRALRRRPHRRGRTVRGVASVLALAAVAAAIATVVVLQRTAPSVIAEARLVPPPGGESNRGDAVIERRPDGVRDIRVDIDDSSGPASGDSYREVWLISSDLTRLVSLGTLDGAEGRFVIPDSVDLADFPIVDVSVEPLDGDPLHSGDTIVRGTLDS